MAAPPRAVPVRRRAGGAAGAAAAVRGGDGCAEEEVRAGPAQPPAVLAGGGGGAPGNHGDDGGDKDGGGVDGLVCHRRGAAAPTRGRHGLLASRHTEVKTDSDPLSSLRRRCIYIKLCGAMMDGTVLVPVQRRRLQESLGNSCSRF